MKTKELKNLAKKIAVLEKKLQNTADLAEKSTLEEEIMRITGKVTNLSDMVTLDDMIQELLEKV